MPRKLTEISENFYYSYLLQKMQSSKTARYHATNNKSKALEKIYWVIRSLRLPIHFNFADAAVDVDASFGGFVLNCPNAIILQHD